MLSFSSSCDVFILCIIFTSNQLAKKNCQAALQHTTETESYTEFSFSCTLFSVLGDELQLSFSILYSIFYSTNVIHVKKVLLLETRCRSSKSMIVEENVKEKFQSV